MEPGAGRLLFRDVVEKDDLRRAQVAERNYVRFWGTEGERGTQQLNMLLLFFHSTVVKLHTPDE